MGIERFDVVGRARRRLERLVAFGAPHAVFRGVRTRVERLAVLRAARAVVVSARRRLEYADVGGERRRAEQLAVVERAVLRFLLLAFCASVVRGASGGRTFALDIRVYRE